MDPVIATATIGTLAVGTILYYSVKSVTPVTPFLYSNARIQARSSQLVTDKKIQELCESKELSELANKLRDTEYGEELDKLQVKDLKNFHKAVEKSFLDSVVELKNLSPKQSQKLFGTYIMFLEAKVLKTIFRAKFYQKELDKELVFEVGNIDNVLLKHLLEAQTTPDLGVVMLPTIYSKVFSKKYESIEEFDVAIEEFVLNKFVETAKKTKMYESSYIIDIINKKIDILNLLAMIKFHIRNIPAEKRAQYMIHNNTKLSSKLDKLVFLESLSEFVENCKDLPYYEALNSALTQHQKDNSLMHFEHKLYKFYKEFVFGQDIAHTLGPYPLFSYLIKKEIEKRNIFIISRGIDAGFSPDKIKELVV